LEQRQNGNHACFNTSFAMRNISIPGSQNNSATVCAENGEIAFDNPALKRIF